MTGAAPAPAVRGVAAALLVRVQQFGDRGGSGLGHGPGEEVLQFGKQDVNITNIEPVGSYGVCLHFDDNHDTGIYSWEWLHFLGSNHNQLWQEYLEKLEAAGKKRSPDA